MKFIIFFIYIPFVYSGFHTITTYTGIYGQTVEGTPEFSAVTALDGQQIDYYDSITETLVPKQEWMKKFENEELWKEHTEIRKRLQQIYKHNIPFLMELFNQTDGVHTYQRMYGCEWDDQTGESQGFDQYGYDGEDFITLDVQKGTYIASVPQAELTAEKWNNDRIHLEVLQLYYVYECVYWLKFFLMSGKAYLKSKAPEVSLLQKDFFSPVVCHATGFYPSGVTITWIRNRQKQHEDVVLGETLPNEDGTFQKISTLNITPDEWKSYYYVCVVEHERKTIRKILTENMIKNNDSLKGPTNSHLMIFVCLVITVFTAAVIYIVVRTRMKKQPNRKSNKKQDYINKDL